MPRIAFFDDDAALGLAPLTLLRPTFELVCGQHTLRERVLSDLSVDRWLAFVRPELEAVYQERHESTPVNDVHALATEPTLLINGRWLASHTAIQKVASAPRDEVGLIGGVVTHLWLDPLEANVLDLDSWDVGLAQVARRRRRVVASGSLAVHPWDLVNHNATLLQSDFAAGGTDNDWTQPPAHAAVTGPPDAVRVHRSARIDPFVVFDTHQGPVTVDADASVQAFTRLEGPCYVGPGSQLFRANVRAGTSIGPVCRVGGEIETSIINGLANKYHDGFIGHSDVCTWVNMGALTTNSDLKNDYSNVRVPLGGIPVDSGLTKVGCFIGDHTKTALGSLFNTGSTIGVMCMVLPAGELLPKHIPSFSRIWHGELDTELAIDQSLDTAAYVMQRRGHELTTAQRRLLVDLHRMTADERKRAVDFQQQAAVRRVGQ